MLAHAEHDHPVHANIARAHLMHACLLHARTVQAYVRSGQLRVMREGLHTVCRDNNQFGLSWMNNLLITTLYQQNNYHVVQEPDFLYSYTNSNMSF
jgi:hypothetical protein